MDSSWIIDATLYLLVFMSFLSWSVALVKTLAVWRQQRMAQRYLQAHWRLPDWAAVRRAGDSGQGEDGGDLAQLSQAGLALCRECAHTDHAPAELYTLLAAALGQEIKRLARRRESGLGLLASISATAPFVGLFGTVWGIMEALVVIGQTGQATIGVVAGPIGEALIATAIGIATAVPALLFYNLLMRRTRLHVTDLEAFAERFLRLALGHRSQWGAA